MQVVKLYLVLQVWFLSFSVHDLQPFGGKLVSSFVVSFCNVLDYLSLLVRRKELCSNWLFVCETHYKTPKLSCIVTLETDICTLHYIVILT